MSNIPDMSPGTRRVMTDAKKLAQDYKHDFITTEHILLSILEVSRLRPPIKGIEVIQGMNIDISDFRNFVMDNLGKYKGTKKPELTDIEPSSRVLGMLTYAGQIAKEMNTDLVSVDHVLLSILVSDAGSGNNLFRLKNIDVNYLYETIYTEVQPRKTKRRKAQKAKQSSEQTPGDVDLTTLESQEKTLDKYTTDLTAQARAGELDPVIGREHEIKSMIQTLNRRTKNNPVLLGEPGVGKTAVVELLAQRIASREVPERLRNKRIHVLDLTRLVAGTIYRGQFEERMKEVITLAQQRDDVLLFIDELHMLVGAGAASGSMDASNILKPALARGQISCIGATTLQEYKEYIEGDGALDRRFQTVLVDQPTTQDTLHILKGIKGKYEDFHKVKYNNKVLQEIVFLCDRYITDKNFPDKAIDVMDELGATMNMSRFKTTDQLIELSAEFDKNINLKNHAVETQQFDLALTYRHTEDQLEQQLQQAVDERESAEINNQTAIRITPDHARQLISDQTGVPLNAMEQDECSKLKRMERNINKLVIGQSNGVEKICSAIKRSRAGVSDPNKPISSLLFLGPTGVGKTMLARTLGEQMFAQDNFKQYDMSEFSEKHSISKLIGSPPGYVGFGEGGSLTEFVRHNPYCVLLFDEIEKAHVEVLQVFLQLLEYGCLTDSEGLEVNFRNTIVVMTSNIGAHLFDKQSSVGFGHKQDTQHAVIEALKKTYAPEFVNRFDELVVFNKLEQDQLIKITAGLLMNLKRNIRTNTKKRVTISPDVASMITSQQQDFTYGARPIKRLITEQIETPLANYMIEHPDQHTIHVSTRDSNIRIK